MANFEVLSLDPTTPQIRAPGAGDGYSVPRDMTFATGTTLNAPTTVVSVNTSTDALRITQVGSGNALLVEDSANPDATPTVISATGNVGIGTTSPGAKLDVKQTGVGSATSVLLSRTTANVLDEQRIVWKADDLTLNYAGIAGVVDSGTTGSLHFQTATAGTLATKAILDASGNLGLGVTPSAWVAGYKVLQVGNASWYTDNNANTYFAANTYQASGFVDTYISSNEAAKYEQFNGAHKWYTAPSGTAGNTITFTQAMTLDASGRLLVGTTSASGAKVDVYEAGSGNATVRIGNAQNGATFDLGKQGSSGYGATSAADAFIYNNGPISMMADSTGIIKFSAGGNTERARITAGGELCVNRTTTSSGAVLAITGTNNNLAFSCVNDGASPNGIEVFYSAAAPNGTANRFLNCEDTGALRAAIRSNGGLANYQSNNVDLSDARTKNSITPAASMWDKIGALEIVTYKYNDQTHDDVNVGVIAQQVESVEPVWVDSDGWDKETPEGEEPLKTVYTKDITFAAIKALQEAMARIEKLEAEVAAMKGVA